MDVLDYDIELDECENIIGVNYGFKKKKKKIGVNYLFKVL